MQNIPNYSDSGQSNGKRQTSPIHASKSEFNLSQNRPNASQLSSSNGQIYQPQPNIGSFPNHSTNKENAAQELKGRETSEKCLDQVDANSLMIDHSKNLKILNEDSAIGSGSTEKIDAELLTEAELLPRMLNVASVGYPVQIYKNGAMWLPYASLHQLSALQNSNQVGVFWSPEIICNCNIFWTMRHKMCEGLPEMSSGRLLGLCGNLLNWKLCKRLLR